MRQDGDLGDDWAHLCVDMQRLFGPGSPWQVPWMDRVLPPIAAFVARCPARTIFTRFIPPRSAGDAPGTWRGYYRKWPDLTRDRLDPAWLGLAPPLAGFCPPAAVVDKGVYSPWLGRGLDDALRDRPVDTLLVTGGETEVCVLSTVLGAVDRGYRVVLAEDALCSVSDRGHDAALALLRTRYSAQVAVAPLAALTGAGLGA